MDGEARGYAVGFQPRRERDEAAIALRNQQILQAVDRYIQRSQLYRLVWEICSYLLCTGGYHDPIPPDPLELLLKDQLSAPDLPLDLKAPGWMLTKKPAIDPLVASLLEQIGEQPRRRRSKEAGTQPATSDRIYQLKVTLEDVHPPIWRRIQVPGDLTLLQLHAVLQIAMDWTNSHLHGFRVGEQFFAEPSPDYLDLKVLDESLYRLSQIAPGVGARFIYEYDFGDGWDHKLVVEQIFSPKTGVTYPRCIAGKRARPPEDVGGPFGYANFLEVIQDHEDPEYDEWLQWAGGQFDPEATDLERANELLQEFCVQLMGRK